MRESDEELMQKYQTGDLAAFEVLYARHKAKVYGYLIKGLKDVNKADEVFQNVFVKLHRKKAQYDPKHAFIKWLFVITRTQMLDFIKGQKVTESFEENLHSEQNEVSPGKIDFGDFNSLSGNERIALSMRYEEDSEFAQIASALGTSPGNARKIISRGLKKIKAALGGEP